MILDAFNDILRGGFGTPEGGFILRRENSELSKKRLDYEELKRVIAKKEAENDLCHPLSGEPVEICDTEEGSEYEEDWRLKIPSMFDWLVEIIRDHGPGGVEKMGNVILELV